MSHYDDDDDEFGDYDDDDDEFDDDHDEFGDYDDDDGVAGSDVPCKEQIHQELYGAKGENHHQIDTNVVTIGMTRTMIVLYNDFNNSQHHDDYNRKATWDNSLQTSALN